MAANFSQLSISFSDEPLPIKRNTYKDWKNHGILRKTFKIKVLQDIVVNWRIRDRQYIGEGQKVMFIHVLTKCWFKFKLINNNMPHFKVLTPDLMLLTNFYEV